MIKISALALVGALAFTFAANAQTSSYGSKAGISSGTVATVKTERLDRDVQTGRSVAIEQPSPETTHSYDFGLKRD